MGKSKSIEKQQKLNKQFQNYINEMTADMDKYQQKAGEQLDSMIVKHYEPYKDRASLMEGQYQHLSTLSEWSLKSVNQIIQSCSNALFHNKNVDGTEKKKTSQEVSDSIQSIQKRELYIASVAFDVVQSVMSSFTNNTKTSVESKVEAKPIAPGMMLFISVVNNSYSRKDFFNNEMIVQTMFQFKVYYSIKEGEMTTKLNDLEAYENVKEAYRKNITDISNLVKKLDVTSEDYLSEITKYSAIVKVLKSNMQDITDEIAMLSGSRANSAITDLESKALCDKVVARHEKALAVWRNQLP